MEWLKNSENVIGYFLLNKSQSSIKICLYKNAINKQDSNQTYKRIILIIMYRYILLHWRSLVRRCLKKNGVMHRTNACHVVCSDFFIGETICWLGRERHENGTRLLESGSFIVWFLLKSITRHAEAGRNGQRTLGSTFYALLRSLVPRCPFPLQQSNEK